MKSFFYPKLAITNIKNHAKTYIPYLITSLFTVTMFYIIYSLSLDKGLSGASYTIPVILQLGTYIMVIFSFIFLFYVNSFLIKRRKKEFALYNILGMEKKHVMLIMFFETLFISFTVIIGGLILGVILSKFMMLLLINVAGFNTPIQFAINSQAVYYTFVLYAIIFFVSFLVNIIQIKLAQPISLLKGEQTGEKEPKVGWLYTILGIMTLSAGYYTALTITDPRDAMLIFFFAVILVIVGTYCLFTSGSIAILKILKKKKSYYYKTNHFISVSQMMYRMKQNAVGLASICILCTCILVMLSSTITLYIGAKDNAEKILPEDNRVRLYLGSLDESYKDDLTDKLCTSLDQHNIKYDLYVRRVVREAYLLHQQKDYYINTGNMEGFDSGRIVYMNQDAYNEAYGHHVSLNDNEVIVASNFGYSNDEIIINDHAFDIVDKVDDKYLTIVDNADYEHYITVVMANDDIIKQASIISNEDYIPQYIYSFDYLDGDEKEANSIITKVTETFLQDNQANGIRDVYSQNQLDGETMYMEMYGSLFFLGVFLGIIFLMATVLIMYYKQISEGYEDQRRYEILQNVGLSKQEVKKAINSQVLIFFFLPICVSVIHMAFAYSIILKMFQILIIGAGHIFIACTVISAIILFVVYSIVYILTSRIYYKIVKV